MHRLQEREVSVSEEYLHQLAREEKVFLVGGAIWIRWNRWGHIRGPHRLVRTSITDDELAAGSHLLLCGKTSPPGAFTRYEIADRGPHPCRHCERALWPRGKPHRNDGMSWAKRKRG